MVGNNIGQAALKQMDTNNDGVVDAAEFAAAGGSKQEFDKYDLNGDGVLDADEMALRAADKLQSSAGSLQSIVTVPQGPNLGDLRANILLARCGGTPGGNTDVVLKPAHISSRAERSGALDIGQPVCTISFNKGVPSVRLAVGYDDDRKVSQMTEPKEKAGKEKASQGKAATAARNVPAISTKVAWTLIADTKVIVTKLIK